MIILFSEKSSQYKQGPECYITDALPMKARTPRVNSTILKS